MKEITSNLQMVLFGLLSILIVVAITGCKGSQMKNSAHQISNEKKLDLISQAVIEYYNKNKDTLAKFPTPNNALEFIKLENNVFSQGDWIFQLRPDNIIAQTSIEYTEAERKMLIVYLVKEDSKYIIQSHNIEEQF